jgi:DNA-binding MarR family transcriptional regulator
MDAVTTPDEISRIESALAEIRRRQQAGQLGRKAGADAAAGALFRALDALETEPLSITELALRVGVDQPRASRLAAEAVRRGLATRFADASDARRSLLRLTTPGRELLAHAHEARRRAVSTALTGFAPDEAATFARLLERFLGAWRA